MTKLVLLCIITNTKNEKETIKLLKKYKANFKNIIPCRGTASHSLLEYFGITETEKSLIISLTPYIMSKHILNELKQRIQEPGKGIAFTIPIASSIKYIEDYYQKIEMEDIKMEDSNQELIITITNEGYAENVMNAAKSAGATGGTTINGRGLETEKIIKFLGISIEPERELVLILTSIDKRNDIMNKITEKCGLTTPGSSICFSLPVTNITGLNKIK